MNKYAIILAAGKGTRMKSKLDDKSKVSYEILGVPIVKYVLDSLTPLNVDELVVVVGFGSKTTVEIVKDYSKTVFQDNQKGTADAVLRAKPLLEGKKGNTFVLCGDAPLIKSETLKALEEKHNKEGNDLTILGARVPNPFGYGRLILNRDELEKIVEEKNTNEIEKKINVVNTGVSITNNQLLFKYLEKIKPNPVTGEYVLVDLVELFVKDKLKVGVSIIEGEEEMKGINDRYQLYEASKIMQAEINKKHMLNGVTIIDSQNTYIGPYVEIGADTVIYPNTHIYGVTKIGEKNIIGPNSYLENVIVGDDNKITMSYLKDFNVGNKNIIGPFENKVSNKVKNAAKKEQTGKGTKK